MLLKSLKNLRMARTHPSSKMRQEGKLCAYRSAGDERPTCCSTSVSGFESPTSSSAEDDTATDLACPEDDEATGLACSSDADNSSCASKNSSSAEPGDREYALHTTDEVCAPQTSDAVAPPRASSRLALSITFVHVLVSSERSRSHCLHLLHVHTHVYTSAHTSAHMPMH